MHERCRDDLGTRPTDHDSASQRRHEPGRRRALRGLVIGKALPIRLLEARALTRYLLGTFQRPIADGRPARLTPSGRQTS
jgi:hypothetical protein